MNGWVKKNVGVIVQVLIILAAAIIFTATAGADIGHIKNDLVKVQEKNIEQDTCLTDIGRSLGRIEGQLEIIVREVHNDG